MSRFFRFRSFKFSHSRGQATVACLLVVTPDGPPLLVLPKQYLVPILSTQTTALVIDHYNMLSLRAFSSPAAQLLRQQSAAVRPSQMVRQTRGLRMQATPRMMRPMPKEEHSAHTISQRIRTLKKIPPELIPLGIVLGIAIGAACYSLIRKFYTDGTLRLYRSRGHNQASSAGDTKPH